VHDAVVNESREVKMSQTLRNLSGTFKEAKAALASGKEEELSGLNDNDFAEDEFNQPLGSEREDHTNEEAKIDNYGASPEPAASSGSVIQQSLYSQEKQSLAMGGGDEDEDVIDIDNPEDLAAKGLKRIQIEGEDEEYLMD